MGGSETGEQNIISPILNRVQADELSHITDIICGPLPLILFGLYIILIYILAVINHLTPSL